MRGRVNQYADVWERVAKGAFDECWPWQGGVNSKGYGQMRVNYKQLPAHRIAYIDATGIQPGELCVLHRCDNPPCCNPAHLFLGTRGDNNRDCAAKGRTLRGSLHHQAKLTEAEVAEIRARRARGEQGIAIAAAFGITAAMVSRIIRRQNWTHA